MTQYSVSYRDEHGELHMIKPFFDNIEEARHCALHYFVEFDREIIPWKIDDDESNLAYPLLENKEVIKAKKIKNSSPKGYEQLTLFN